MAAASWVDPVAYDAYMGRWSRPVAGEFLDRLGVPDGRRWLDVGCGTGVLTEQIILRCAPAAVLGIDPSAAFVAAATEGVRDPRAGFRTGDAEHLPLADGEVDVVVSGLVVNLLPDAAAGVAEMRRVTRAGGTVAAYVWDYADGMDFLRIFWAAVSDAVPDTTADEGQRFPVCRPGPLRELFAGAELVEVTVDEVVVPTVFRDFADLWAPFLTGVGVAPAFVTSLDEGTRTALRETFRARLPVANDGSIPLRARAWSVRGRRA